MSEQIDFLEVSVRNLLPFEEGGAMFTYMRGNVRVWLVTTSLWSSYIYKIKRNDTNNKEFAEEDEIYFITYGNP